MNALNIFIVIFVIGASVGNICGKVMETSLEPSAPGYIEPLPEIPSTTPTIPPVTASPTPTIPPVTASPTPTPMCPKCFRNVNGMCKKIIAACTVNESFMMNNLKWDPVPITDCAQRDFDEVKVCSSDCDKYRIGICQSTLKPVCAYSIKTGLCKKFANACLFKQDACRYPTITDWRVTQLVACNYLRIGGPAGTCMPI